MQSVEAGRGNSEPVNVWLVDDSGNFRELLADLLQDEGGIQCTAQFASAEAVLEALSGKTPPDVIVLDVRMPGMGGVAAVHPIRELAPETHVLMLTTFGDAHMKAKALADGATDFLLKSYEIGQIASRIRETQYQSVPAITSGGSSRESASAKDAEHSSNRFLRGMSFLRNLMTQPIWKSNPRKQSEALISVETA
jgi:DNA-binding NarL/FixJ family response regulator